MPVRRPSTCNKNDIPMVLRGTEVSLAWSKMTQVRIYAFILTSRSRLWDMLFKYTAENKPNTRNRKTNRSGGATITSYIMPNRLLCRWNNFEHSKWQPNKVAECWWIETGRNDKNEATNACLDPLTQNFNTEIRAQGGKKNVKQQPSLYLSTFDMSEHVAQKVMW